MTSSNSSNRQTSHSGNTGVFARKSRKNSQSVEVNSLLRSQIAHLWPTITNLTALQKQCVSALPQLFFYCQVLRLDSGQLIVAVPTSAIASKLKQQLPKLQAELQNAGWQINAIRLKVQVSPVLPKETVPKQLRLPGTAIKAFSELEKSLGTSNQNEPLRAALRNLLSR